MRYIVPLLAPCITGICFELMMANYLNQYFFLAGSWLANGVMYLIVTKFAIYKVFNEMEKEKHIDKLGNKD